MHAAFQQHPVLMSSHAVTPGTYQYTCILLFWLALKQLVLNVMLKGILMRSLISLASDLHWLISKCGDSKKQTQIAIVCQNF